MNPDEIFALSLAGMVFALVAMWIRQRGGRAAGKSREQGLLDDRKIQLLSEENERLAGQIGRLQERLSVVERIVTDPAERTARAIEALREVQEVR